MHIRNLVLMSAAVASLSACGGDGGYVGGSGVTPINNAQPLPAGSYKLAFAAISTARLDAPISGIDLAVKLPTGVSVSTASGGSGQIASASITPGSAIFTTSLAFGNYSASTRTAYLSMATSQTNFRGGQFLNLLFSVASGANVTPNDIFALNVGYPKVVGLDTATHSTVTMTGKVKTTLGVER